MRRSSVVKLTLVPLLAASALAYADITDDPPPMEPTTLAPPGMTPTIQQLDCDHDPNWQLRDDCQPDDEPAVSYGGFGGYFWTGGG